LDKGTDGIKVFVDDNSGKSKRVIFQVKSGHGKSCGIRDLVVSLEAKTKLSSLRLCRSICGEAVLLRGFEIYLRGYAAALFNVGRAA